MKLSNKIILVTGGSGLLGSAIIEDITKHGGTAVSVDVNFPESNVNGIFCDITNENSINSLISEVESKYGRIDGLVNNAYPRTKDWGLKFEDIPYQSWKDNVDIQMNSVFLLTQKISKGMSENEFGSIVNMASIYGVVGPDFSVYGDTGMTMPAAYSAIKGGLINFTRYLSSYLGKYNIRINCVSPGGIFDGQNPEFVKRYSEKVPMRRMGTPSDISSVVSFLLSEESKYITGQNLIVDGGWTAI